MADYHNEKHDEKEGDAGIKRPGDDGNIKAGQRKPSVHYTADVHEVPAPGYPYINPPKPDWKAPSVIGTDDEHEEEDDGEDYDWSAEEDLEDQAVEFEKHMGIKRKPQGWGFRRYISFACIKIVQ
jgi:hypothetical protein